MNRIVKFLLGTIAAVFIFFAAYTYYNSHFSRAAKIGRTNCANVKLVKLQMTQKEVLVIMGEPSIVDTSKDDYVIYKYLTNDDSYAFISIYFDSSMIVREIYTP